MSGAAVPPGIDASQDDTQSAWCVLIDEIRDQLDQWSAYLADPSVETLPIGGLPPIPTGPVPDPHIEAIERITERVQALTEHLDSRSVVVSEEIDRVRKTRTAAAAYTS